jgi:hypothetical protein
VRITIPATAIARKLTASSSSGSRRPPAPTSTPASTGPASIPADVNVWEMALARGTFSTPTMSGISAAKTGWVTATPHASSPLSAMSAAGAEVASMARQHSACTGATATTTRRLSKRSAARPVRRASSTGGNDALNSRAATAYPPAPRCCSTTVSAVAAR